MPNTPKPTELWGDDPQDHDFSAACDYLSLQYAPAVAETLAASLRSAPTTHVYKAKDILRGRI